MKKLTLESTAPFQGLPELVAYDEGLFKAEGIEVDWVDRDAGPKRGTQKDINSPVGVDPFASHGKLFEEGKADMYNACEWGNYCRVQDSDAGGRQVGRRAIVAFGALVVPPNSGAYTPQQMASKVVGLPYYFGTHFLALLMLEGFLPRDQIKTCKTPNGSRRQYDALLRGDYDGACLTEPYISLAEKQGCRVLAAASFHGTEVVSDEVDVGVYAAFNRAVTEAVGRINADKQSYMNYFIDYYKDRDPEISAVLTVNDLRPSRLIVQKPGPIPEAELARSYEWIRSWGMLAETTVATNLVDMESQDEAHSSAE
jgi:NitT/TauT family transport system substrate-binding protein